MSGGLTVHNARSEDAAALDVRSRLNNERGSFDLAAWIGEHARLGPEARLLDVGCGTGQLLLRYGETALRHGRCVAVDVSAGSLALLGEAAAHLGDVGLEIACLDMDALASPGVRPEWTGFTHIVSAYSLYYSADATRLLGGLQSRLHPEGTLLVVAPAPSNNAAWFALLERAGVEIPASIRAVSTFLERIVLPFGRRSFASVEVRLATNTVRLASADEVEAYWRSNTYFDDAATPAVRAAAEAACRAPGGFVNEKHVGLVAMRGRKQP
jgi:SAM-dependent methyltransferase